MKQLKSERGLESRMDHCQDETDHLGQPRQFVLTLYGLFKNLPCYTDSKGRFFVKGKMSLHLSPQSSKVCVTSMGIHLGFYADHLGAIYMHHQACKEEDIKRLTQSPSRPLSMESKQADESNAFPLTPRLIKHGDRQVIRAKYPWDGAQREASSSLTSDKVQASPISTPTTIQQIEKELQYNMMLQLVREADNGDLFYKDDFGRDLIKMDDRSPKVNRLCASYQGDHYTGEDGVFYQFVPVNGKIPHWRNSWPTLMKPRTQILQASLDQSQFPHSQAVSSTKESSSHQEAPLNGITITPSQFKMSMKSSSEHAMIGKPNHMEQAMNSQAVDPTPQLQVAAAHQSPACIENALSVSLRESPRKGGIPPSVGPKDILPSSGLKELPLTRNNTEDEVTAGYGPLASNIAPHTKKVSPVVAAAFAKPLQTKEPQSHEHMVVDIYLLIPKGFGNKNLCLFENQSRALFQVSSMKNGKPVSQSNMPQSPLVYKCLHVTHLTYTFKDKEGNEYEPYNGRDATLSDQEFEQSRTCVDCGVAHLLRDCPMLLTRKRVSRGSATGSSRAATPQQVMSPTSSTHSFPKASLKSPPKSPPKRLIRPQGITNLLKSQVMELQAENEKLNPRRDASIQSATVLEQVPQVHLKMRSPKDANEGQTAKDGVKSMHCEKATTCSNELLEDQRAKISMKDIEITRKPQCINDSINTARKLLVKDVCTRLDTTERKQREKPTNKADVRATQQGNVQATSKLLEPVKITKPIGNESDPEEQQRQEASVHTALLSKDQEEARGESSVPQRILLDFPQWQCDQAIKTSTTDLPTEVSFLWSSQEETSQESVRPDRIY